jgi:hypothetical protein
MTEEQVLQMIKEHFKEGGIRDDSSCFEYYGDLDAFLKFASKLYYQGRYDGYEDGRCDGYSIGADASYYF